MSAVPGTDYYFRIKDVLDRISNIKALKKEKAAFDQYKQALTDQASRDDFDEGKDDDTEAEIITPSKRARHKSASRQPPSPRIDLSWKEGRKHFPKKTSRVGEEYQATKIPLPGAFVKEDNPSSEF